MQIMIVVGSLFVLFLAYVVKMDWDHRARPQAPESQRGQR